jgi:hypothetical protein
MTEQNNAAPFSPVAHGHFPEDSDVYTALVSGLQDDQHTDFFIDPIANPSFSDSLREAVPEQIVSLTDPMFEPASQQAPFVLRLERQQPAHKALMLQCLDQAQRESLALETRSVCALLVNRLPLPELAAHLSPFLSETIDTLGVVYFRYFDPRVTQWLRVTYQASTFQALTKPAAHWFYPHWTGQWLDLVPIANTADLTRTRKAPTFDILTAMNQALGLLARGRKLPRAQPKPEDTFDSSAIPPQQVLLKKPYVELDTSLFAAALEGRDKGLTNTQDMGDYAVLTYLHGKRFTAHPHLAQCVQLTQQSIPFYACAEQHMALSMR